MAHIRLAGVFAAAAVLSCTPALAQTTQGTIAGRVFDARTGKPVVSAGVFYHRRAAQGIRAIIESGSTRTGADGFYALSSLSPGVYQLRADAGQEYQPQEIHELELHVAARLELNFALRALSDAWEAGTRNFLLPGNSAIVHFYAADVANLRSAAVQLVPARTASLQSTVSYVIDPATMERLPLAGRDVFTTLVMQPGVTADHATARGLGISANGQRPSSSNFLLDGVENNDYLVSGPLTTVAPEAVQEYRVSTNNFSAEYGRTGGFVANAVTRAGGRHWHGLGYFYFKNDVLNGNDFQRNLYGLPRSPLKEAQPGFSLGGPVRAETLFASGAFEYLRFRSQREPEVFRLPTAAFSPVGSLARSLMQRYRPPAAPDGAASAADFVISPPSSLNRYLAVPRIDSLMRGGSQRVMVRAVVARLRRPDMLWTPYEEFISPLRQNNAGLSAAWTASLPGLTSESRISWSSDLVHVDRTRPEVPTLQSFDGTMLPGSPAFYGYRNRSRNWQLVENLAWVKGRHALKIGGGALLRQVDGQLTLGRDGYYAFGSLQDFGSDRPGLVYAAVSRANAAQPALPDYARRYRYDQFFAFAEDSFRAAGRLVLNYGVRYENFGAPRNTGQVKDAIVHLGSGATFAEQLVSRDTALVFPGPGDQPLYRRDNNDWAVRAGFSYALRSSFRTVLRGAYGVFYDRPFDNLWQNLRNNAVAVESSFLLEPTTDYLRPVSSLLRSFPDLRLQENLSRLLVYQPEVRSPYVHSYFFGLQHQVTASLALEINTLGSAARKLITTDVVNRIGGIRNPTLGTFGPGSRAPLVHYRGNEGASDYNGLTIVARHRGRRSQFQAAYTWSHAIDNQSEPLAGDFFDLNFIRGGVALRPQVSSFTVEFDGAADRGNADFDQRHNLAFFSVWELPGPVSASRFGTLLRGWSFAQLAAFRSGFPYSVHAFTPGDLTVFNNRANVLDPRGTAARRSAPGGVLLLNREAFGRPGFGQLGNSGRNVFAGPGVYSMDVSLSRTVPLRALGEGGRVSLRADVFNVLNHANLNNPDPFLASPAFGVAQYGRRGRSSGFPALLPFHETARQVQLMLRVEF
jgi:hypothetical protein